MKRGNRIAVMASAAAMCLVTLAPSVRASHSVSITISPPNGVWGTVFNIRGSTTPNTEYRLQRKYFGQSNWVNLTTRTTTSDGSGNFVQGDAPYQQADYRAIIVSDTSSSQWARVYIRPGVHIAVSRTSGERALFTGKVLPVHPGTPVVLQMFDGLGRRWNNVARSTLNRNSAYAISYKACSNCRRLFRVAWPTGDQNHLWNISAEAFVTWTS